MKKFFYSVMSALILVPALASAQWEPGNVQEESQLPEGTIFNIIMFVMKWLLGLVGFIGVIGFVISGILYFIAAGDSGKMETAKNAMVYSIIGVVVALIGFVIIQAVDAMLGGDSTTF